MAAQTGKRRICRQCGKKNAIPPAYLCATCKRNNKKASSAKRHDAYVQETYGLAPGEYDDLLALQGGVCYICEGGKSAKRRLAVDHDHKTGRPRGLLCRRCNYVLLGQMARDNIEKLVRILSNAIDYLQDPPYDRIVRNRDKNTSD